MAAESDAAIVQAPGVIEITIGSFAGMSVVGPGGGRISYAPSEMRMQPPCCYADVVARIEEHLISNGMPQLLDMMMLICEGRLVGHTTSLSEPMVASKQFTVMLCLGAGSNASLKAVGPPYQAYKHGTPWPPAVNYYGDEPINMGKIGQYKDGECICCDTGEQHQQKHNNSPGCLVVLDYGGLAGRVVYNRWTLLDYLTMNSAEPELRDPQLRRRILDQAKLCKDLCAVICGEFPRAAGDYIPVISVETE